MRRVPIGLSVAIAVYVALRALILHTNFESVALPMYELYPMGTMAELTLRGIEFPLRYFYDNAAGQILMGFLTVPVFAVFGSSYLALKLLPAALGLATLILVWKLLDRHFGRTAANIAAFLFAVGPPTLTKYSLINSGNHFENLAFTMLAFVLAYRWFASAEKKRGGLFVYALSCGIALFVFLGALIPIGILFGMHLGLRGLRKSARDLPVLAAGFGLGIAPLVIVNAATSARGMGFLDAKFGNENSGRGADVLARSLDFIGWRLLEAPVFEPFAGLSGALLSGLFLAAFAIAWLASLPSIATSITSFARWLIAPPRSSAEEVAAFEHARLVPFVIYVPLAALAYGISNFRLGGHAPPVEVAGFRYFLPTILFALILIAVWADRWITRGGAARLAGFALLTAVAIPCASSLAIVDWRFSATGIGPRLDGFNLAQMARALLSARNAVPHEEVVARVEALPPDVRFQVQSALGFNSGVQEVAAAQKRRSEGPDVSARFMLDPVIERYPASWSVPLQRGAGAALRWSDRSARRDLIATLVAAAWLHGSKWTPQPHLSPIFGPDSWPEATVGAAATNVALLLPSETLAILVENDTFFTGPWHARPRHPEFAWFPYGHGVLCGRLWARGIPSDREWIAGHTPPESQDWPDWSSVFARGLGEGFGRESRNHDGVDEVLQRVLPPHLHAHFWLGYGRAAYLRFGDEAGAVLVEIQHHARAEDVEAMTRGVALARTGDANWTVLR